MQQPTLLALLGALSSVAAASSPSSAGSLPRGVGPDFASYYASKDEFACIRNPSIKISFDRVNDNTCDCPDGSDEPGTAACAFIDPLSPEQPLPGSASGTTNSSPALPGFWCENKGHVGGYVPFSYVNDGVCDYDLCCDGSDEYRHVGGVRCENRCAAIGGEYRRKKEEQRRNMERAGHVRSAMLKESSEMRKALEAKIADVRKEIRSLEVRKAQLQSKYEDAKREDRGRVVKGPAGGKLGVLIGLAKDRVAELRRALDLVAQDRETLRGKVSELETILRKFKEEYNPNFNDEGVKAAVKSFEDYAAREATATEPERGEEISQTSLDEILKEDDETTGVNWKAFEEFGDDTAILFKLEAYLPPSLRAFIHDKLLLIRGWLIDSGVIADTSDGSESSAVKVAREAVESVERQLTDQQRSLKTETTDLEKNYGPSDIFRSIKGRCTTIDSGEYTYELCWMDKTTQISKKGHGHTNMGNFFTIDREMADDEDRVDGKSLGKGERMVMRFEHGQQCWNGPQRRTDVWLACAEKEEVWRVVEAEKCVYKMEVGTPAACEEEDVVERERSRDEL
ncbi:Glucosidase 2 subunit beta [Escovopsis weberi]|uniref:Glucosidase 2 subunit beta n=1 Tax=Escovopsis weberi TaxID=150374 RepID=A0A0M8N4Z0_ESCWE|nr:Glucosidase 2 subunit beta [Escovopsis weberi]